MEDRRPQGTPRVKPPVPVTAALWLAMVLCMAWPAGAGVVVRQELKPNVFAAIKGGRVLYLECRPPRGEAAKDFFADYLANPEEWTQYRDRLSVAVPFSKLNHPVRRQVLEAIFPEDYVDEMGWWHRVIFEGAEGEETLWALAEWLTGIGTNYRTVLQHEANAHLGADLSRGHEVLIPRELLLPVMRTLSPNPPVRAAHELVRTPPEDESIPNLQGADPEDDLQGQDESQPQLAAEREDEDSQAENELGMEAEEDTAEEDMAEQDEAVVHDAPLVPSKQPGHGDEPTAQGEGGAMAHEAEPELDPDSPLTPPPAAEGVLAYAQDEEGPYAEYSLKKGEALYTAVVVAFTDFQDNAEIHTACRLIQERSGIDDVRKMEAGQKIRIPLGMLSDKYQPLGSERRGAYEAVQAEAARLRASQVRTRDLSGCVIILDPGHGGRDQGAAVSKLGLYEDELAYDIVARTKKILEEETRAKVYVTMKDLSHGYAITSASRFQHDTDEVVLTDPNYDAHDARVSAHLRWCLANRIYADERRRGVDERKILFLSVHCDAIFNANLRGAMVYVPGAKWRRDEEQLTSAIYQNYAEARNHGRVRTTAAQRRRDEAMSRNFANTFINALRTNTPPIKVHSASDPIRNVIRRSRNRSYVPAVLRNTVAPTKILIETANMTNPTDQQRLADPKWRQWFAEATVIAIRRHFDE